MPTRLPCLWPYLCLALSLVGCAPAIGDACETPLDCSSQGSRLCDRTQPAGYCTVQGCEQGTCPEDSVCVEFRPCDERLAVTYCMLKCSDSSDCRDDEGYRCTSAAKFGEGMKDAKILGSTRQKFCSIPPLAGTSPADAGADAGMVVDAGECRAFLSE
jgi:hypothetical protein